MKKSVFLASCAIVLSACVSEPIDPAFKGSEAVDTKEAAKTRVSLGLTYLKNGNFSQAKSNIDRALKFDPRSSDAHFAMAFYFQQVDEIELAEQYYERALDLSDNDPDIVNSYGVFLCKQGKYDKAKKYFLDAVNAKSYAATAETYENLAICAQSQGDMNGAIEYFNSALNHQPTRSSTLLMLTNLYVDQSQWDDAKKKLMRYERSAPVSANTLFLNYQIAQGRGDSQTAVGYGNLLVRNYPDHEFTRQYLSNVGKVSTSTSEQQKESGSVTLVSSKSANEVDKIQKNASNIIQRKPSKTVVQKTPATASAATEEALIAVNEPDAGEVNELVISEETVAADTEQAITEVETLANNALKENEEPFNAKINEKTNEQNDEQVVLANEEANEVIQQSDDDTIIASNRSAEEVEGNEDDLSQQPLIAARAEVNSLSTMDSPADGVSEAQLISNSSMFTTAEVAEVAEEQAINVVEVSSDEPEDSSYDALGDGWHVVQKKENLYRISLKYNVSMAKLMEWNGLNDASDILWGSRMRVKEPITNE